MTAVRRTFGTSIVSGALTLVAFGCSKQATPVSSGGGRGRPNLVLITMDTTRADHLGCYGDRDAATPRLDALARDGVVFDHAFAVAPLTFPSHASMLTGRYPPATGVRDNGDFRLPEAETTLAEHLRAQGYRARASVGSFVLAGELGLAQGFEAYAEPPAPRLAGVADPAVARLERIPQRPAARVADEALTAIDAMKSGPFFLWVHFFDPHSPYTPPPPYAEAFKSRPYDGEIASMDAAIGRIVDGLSAAGVTDRTIVAAIADHGESLGEHGEATHGIYLYDATLHVPLIVRYPAKLRAGSRYAGLVSGVDLAPTLLELMELPPLPAAQGSSVASALVAGSVAEREPVYAESVYGERAYGWSPLFALRSASEKFIEAPEPEVYAVEADPGETKNLASGRPADLAAWRKRLADDVSRMGPSQASAASASDDEQRREALRSLGYVSGGAPGLARKNRPDPKTRFDVHLDYMKALELVDSGKTSEAETLLAKTLARDPGNPAVTSLLGSLRFSSTRRAEGLAQLRAAAAAAPGVWTNQWNLANALLEQGLFEDAVAPLRAVVAIGPEIPESYYALGNALAGAGHAADAVLAYRQAAGRGLKTAALNVALGAALVDGKDVAGAEAAFRESVRIDPSCADCWNKLGILLDRTGRRPDAMEAFEKAIAADPGHPDALFNRGRIRLLGGDAKAARADVDALLARHPDYAAARLLEANVCEAEGNRAGARAALRELIALPGAAPNLKAAGRAMLAKLGE